MTWGIIVYESFGRYTSFTMADDNFYEGMKEVPGMDFINGKKGITSEEIDNISEEVSGLIKRVNDGVSLDLKKELEFMF